MNIRFYTLAALLGLSSLSLSAAPDLPKTGLAGSPHDIGGIGCKSCHAPHNGAAANGGPQSTGQILLWARSFPASSNTFGVYDSATMKNKAVDLGGSALTTSTDVRMYSLLCLSCHDGVTSSFSPAMASVNQIGSKAAFGAGAFESLGLTNDHPVNMTYDPTKNPALRPVATVSASLPLYGTTNTMQCGTCHDPHNDVNTNFLRLANNTANCTTCHL
ncbi:MAG TPA: cytochrome c3 family protein [Candidatus Acidoferrales bacterium]|jgi:predicted CXXCH cytochrome family protein|nr:cytochrome c3 family protein [Candidatus Acidoferrales bacterium]